jgi:hypothetical protein
MASISAARYRTFPMLTVTSRCVSRKCRQEPCGSTRAISGGFSPSTTTMGMFTQKRILDSLDRISGQSEQAHAVRALKTFLNWCEQREYLEQNPMLTMKMPKEPDARERVLTDDELMAIGKASPFLKSRARQRCHRPSSGRFSAHALTSDASQPTRLGPSLRRAGNRLTAM